MSLYIVILIFIASQIAPAISNIIIYINFKIHQDYIAKQLCVQKEIDDNKCQGCCQLKKEVEKNETPQVPALLKNLENLLFLRNLNSYNDKILNHFWVVELPNNSYSLIFNHIKPDTPPPKYFQ